eukprot:1156093-Pelagomonas_calceolata.AAC.2
MHQSFFINKQVSGGKCRQIHDQGDTKDTIRKALSTVRRVSKGILLDTKDPENCGKGQLTKSICPVRS